MRLTGRVRTLERASGVAGPCPLCRGRGRGDAVLVRNGLMERQPRGCPRCGKVGTVKRIILGDGGDERAAWPGGQGARA
jgi:hypothetical protein